MGGALATGWLAGGLDPASLRVIAPSPPESSKRFLAERRVAVDAAPPAGLKARALVVAVKPQIVKGVLPGLATLVAADTLVLSIAAGIKMKTLDAGLGAGMIV